MSLYRAYFTDKVGYPAGWKPIRSDSDSGARKSAFAMLRERSDIYRVEVWRESDLAFRLSRFDIATRSPHQRLGT